MDHLFLNFHKELKGRMMMMMINQVKTKWNCIIIIS